MADKLIPEDTESWVLIPAIEILGEPHGIGVAGIEPIDALTAGLVNEYLAITSQGHADFTGAGGNITRAVRNDATLALSASETDDDAAINDFGNVVTPTSQNYDAEIHTFRDKNPGDTASNYNLASDLLRARGIRYIAFRRIGLAWNTAAADGQKYNAFYVETDNPIDEYGDGANQTLGMTFVTKSVAVTDATVAA